MTYIGTSRKEVFKQKIELLKVTLPEQYRGMLENLKSSFDDSLKEDWDYHMKYWVRIIEGVPQYLSFSPDKDGPGKLYKLTAELVYKTELPTDPVTTIGSTEEEWKRNNQ